MAESEVVEVDRSSKSLSKDVKGDNICGYCGRKVLDYISCIKCDGIFHPSCMSKSSSGKTPVCLHVPVEKRSETEADEMDFRILKMENSYLKALVEELKSKNEILMQNNALLIDKLSLIGNNEDKNDRKKVNNSNNTRMQVQKPNILKLATISDSVDSVLPMRPTQNVLDVSSENVNSYNLNKISKDQERSHSLKLSVPNKNDEIAMSQEKREWTEVKNRRTKSLRPKGIICKGTTSSFSGVPQKRWIYVGRIAGKDVEEGVIEKYVRAGLGSDLVEVKKLVSKGSNSSFSVGVPSENMYKKIMNEEFWPNGVLIRDFSFKNFFQKNSIVKQKTR